MIHLSFFSGGLGSWKTTKRLIEQFGIENVRLLFTDTFIEDKGLYRFLIETTQEMYGIDCADLIELVENIPKVSHETMQDRKVFLRNLADQVMQRNKFFIAYQSSHLMSLTSA